MRWIIKLACLISLLTCVAIAAPQRKILNIQTWKTPKGARLFFVKAPELPMVDVRVIFAAGSAYDGVHYGLAALTNNLLSEGTYSKTANQIAADFDSVGAQFGYSAGRDRAVVQLRSLVAAQYLQPALNTFSDVLANASFPKKAIARVKAQTVAGIRYGQQRPTTIAKNALYKALYSQQAYAHPVLGTLKSVALLNKKQLEQFYKQYYVANNANIIIVGDVSFTKAKQITEQITKGLPQGHPAVRLKDVASIHQAIFQHVNYPAKQTTILLGQIGINRKNPDFFPLIVGNYILGGMPLSSILFKDVRSQRGLVYYAYSHFSLLQSRGPFFIQLQTRAAKTEQALKVVNKALQRFVKNGPTDSQLKAAKQNLMGSFALNLASNSNILSVVSDIAFYHRPLNYLDHYRARIQAVTALQVQKAFQKIVHPNKMVTITVGPKQ